MIGLLALVCFTGVCKFAYFLFTGYLGLRCLLASWIVFGELLLFVSCLCFCFRFTVLNCWGVLQFWCHHVYVVCLHLLWAC